MGGEEEVNICEHMSGGHNRKYVSAFLPFMLKSLVSIVLFSFIYTVHNAIQVHDSSQSFLKDGKGGGGEKSPGVLID